MGSYKYMSIKHSLLNRFGLRLMRLDDLTCLMNQAGSDKGFGLLGRHYYTRIYNQIFQHFRNQAITFVEIGLLRPDRDKRRSSNASEAGNDASLPSKPMTAPSLAAWRAYFPRAKIVGFDIDDFSNVHMPSVTILQGDMSKPTDLQRIIAAAPGGIDVLIDDGSHVSHHQQIAFKELFPAIKPGGIYVVEDCHWQDPVYEKPGSVQTRHMLAEFRRNGRFVSPEIEAGKAEALARQIGSIGFYDSLQIGADDTEDALCVIRKKASGE
jgi:hypothetical protein